MHRYFATVYERRIAANHLDNDQSFPYPVTDLYNQYVIPEDLAYVPIENPVVEPILKNAEAVSVVRDGYASVFFHSFLNPVLLDRLISGIEAEGYHFVDLRSFPNAVQSEGNIITTQSGEVKIAGKGRYLNEEIFGPKGEPREEKTLDVTPQGFLSRRITFATGRNLRCHEAGQPSTQRLSKAVPVRQRRFVRLPEKD